MASSKLQKGVVRIISGHLRSQKIYFNDDGIIRPTTDRVKETLFNWLRSDIQGSHCLDLFSGSGSLGFEAFSRGAKSVMMCDSNLKTIKMLQENQNRFHAHCSFKHITFNSSLPNKI